MSSTTSEIPTVISTAALLTPASTPISQTEKINGKVASSSCPYTYGSVCLLCLRTKTCTSVKSDPEKHRQSQLTCVKYVVLVSRYLKLDTDLTKIAGRSFFNLSTEENDESLNNNGVDAKDEINKYVVCDLCLPLAESFCKTYQEYELSRMKLEAKMLESTACVQKSEGLHESLRALRGIKRGSMKTPGPGFNQEDALISFRNKLKTHGSEVPKLNEPRLQLKRDKKLEDLLQQKKVPKLLMDSPVTSNATKSPNNSVDKNSCMEISSTTRSGPNPSVKIVRRAAGTNSEAPEVSIVRVSSQQLAETNSNDDSDIQVINVIQKRNSASTTNQTSSGVEVRMTSPVKQTDTVVPTTLSTPIISIPNNFIPNSLAGQRVSGQDFAFTASSNMMQMQLQLPIEIQKCGIKGCQLTFPKTEQGLLDIQRHLHVHTDHQCMKCPAILKTPLELISHELKHDETNQSRKVKQGFQCTRCPHYSMHRTGHQEHFLERHLNAKIELLKCQLCKKGFSHLKQKQFRTHTTKCHPNENTDDLSMCHSCMICRVYFKKKATLWKHLKNDHRVNHQDGPHKCHHCSHSFFFYNLLQLHREFSCEQRASLECSVPQQCISTFTTGPNLVQRHLEEITHNNLQVSECPICKLKFFDLNTLKYHVQTHNGEQVKLVFTDGNNQEAQVIPVETSTSSIVSNETSIPSVMNSPAFYQSDSNGSGVVTSIPTIESHLQTPVILSVTGAPQISVSSSSVIPTFANIQNSILHDNNFQSSEMVPAVADTKLLDRFFDESNDSEEHLMEFFENVISEDASGEQLPPPDEDPFAWMFSDSEDFSIS